LEIVLKFDSRGSKLDVSSLDWVVYSDIYLCTIYSYVVIRWNWTNSYAKILETDWSCTCFYTNVNKDTNFYNRDLNTVISY